METLEPEPHPNPETLTLRSAASTTTPAGSDLAAGHSPHCPPAHPHLATPNPNLRPTQPPPPPTSTTGGGRPLPPTTQPTVGRPRPTLVTAAALARHREEEGEMRGKEIARLW
jgi:hypothetical protein